MQVNILSFQKHFLPFPPTKIYEKLFVQYGKRQIPHCKNGKKLYFYEEKLLEWIEKGKQKTIQEIEEIVLQNRRRF